MASRHRPRCATLIPNSTCDFASPRVSANDGDAVMAAAHATSTITGPFMGEYRPLYRTSQRNRASDMPQLDLEIGRNCAQNDLDDLRKTDALSYISRQGGRASRNAGAAAAALLCAGGGPPRPRGVVMIDLVELVALSLLPLKCWRRAFDALRGGESPARILGRLAGHLPPDNPFTLARLRSDAAARIARAERQAIAPIAWSGTAYPLAL